jgi:tripartite ATP-independent transporter DctM subunit
MGRADADRSARIGFILYGTVGQVSIGRLFASGFVPAFLLWAALAFTIAFTAKRRGIAAERKTRPTLGEFGTALRGGIWAILFPILLLVGLRMGVFTPSEIGAFAVVYAVFIGVVVYRQLKRAGFREAIEGSLSDVGAVMFLIALSGIFSYGIVFERVPEVVSGTILGVTDNLHGVMTLILLFILIAGCFVDGSVLIIMLTPIFLPLIRDLNGDPVHFGLVFVMTATIGNFTPPVGAAMYAVLSILKCPMGDYARESPFHRRQRGDCSDLCPGGRARRTRSDLRQRLRRCRRTIFSPAQHLPPCPNTTRVPEGTASTAPFKYHHDPVKMRRFPLAAGYGSGR